MCADTAIFPPLPAALDPILAALRESPALIAGGGAMVAAVIAAAAAASWLIAPARDPIAERLAGGEVVIGEADPALRAAGAPSALTRLLRSLGVLARPSTEETGRLRERLAWGGLRGRLAVEAFLGAKLALGLLSGGGFSLITLLAAESMPYRGAIGVALTAAGFFAPNAWLGRRVAQRQRDITRGLADALDLLVVCVEAGLGLEAAIDRVVGELGLSAPVLAAELGQSMLEIRAGVPRAETFRRLAARTGVDELRALAATLVQTEMFGTSVGTALRTQAQAMRVQRTHRAEERGAMAAARMVLPLVLFILPALLTVIIGPASIRIARTLIPIMEAR